MEKPPGSSSSSSSSSVPSPSVRARLFLASPFLCSRACRLYGGGGGGGCKGGCGPEPEALPAQEDGEEGDEKEEEEEEDEEAEAPPEPRSSPSPPPPSSPPPVRRGRESRVPSVPPSPTLRRRAKSLPLPGERGLRPAALHPPAPSARKTVRFADCLGLELAAVRHFSRAEDYEEEEEDPRLRELLKTRRPPSFLGPLEPFVPPPSASASVLLEPLFPPSPGSSSGFAERLREQKVQLEWVRAEASSSSASSSGSLLGAARVLNLAFQKDVSVRYSLDRWASALEAPARYQPDPRLGSETDRFAFRIPLPADPLHQRGPRELEFALRYRVAGKEYWDNNRGGNYRLRARRAPEAQGHDGPAWIHFI